MIWSFYNSQTGHFIGRTFSGNPQDLDANTPLECRSIPGEIDHVSWMVNPNSGELIDYQPPPPQDDDLTNWAWGATERRWVSYPTLNATKARRIFPVDQEIAAQERRQLRPQGAIIAALLDGSAPPKEDAAMLAALRTSIAASRLVRAAIMAATNADELAAIQWPAV